MSEETELIYEYIACNDVRYKVYSNNTIEACKNNVTDVHSVDYLVGSDNFITMLFADDKVMYFITSDGKLHGYVILDLDNSLAFILKSTRVIPEFPNVEYYKFVDSKIYIHYPNGCYIYDIDSPEPAKLIVKEDK